MEIDLFGPLTPDNDAPMSSSRSRSPSAGPSICDDNNSGAGLFGHNDNGKGSPLGPAYNFSLSNTSKDSIMPEPVRNNDINTINKLVNNVQAWTQPDEQPLPPVYMPPPPPVFEPQHPINMNAIVVEGPRVQKQKKTFAGRKTQSRLNAQKIAHLSISGPPVKRSTWDDILGCCNLKAQTLEHKMIVAGSFLEAYNIDIRTARGQSTIKIDGQPGNFVTFCCMLESRLRDCCVAGREKKMEFALLYWRRQMTAIIRQERVDNSMCTMTVRRLKSIVGLQIKSYNDLPSFSGQELDLSVLLKSL